MESVLSNKFNPVIFGGDRPDVPDELLALNPKDGGLGIEIPLSIATYQYNASMFKTQIHTETIMNQGLTMQKESIDGKSEMEIEMECKRRKERERKERIEGVELPDHLQRCVEQAETQEQATG